MYPIKLLPAFYGWKFSRLRTTSIDTDIILLRKLMRNERSYWTKLSVYLQTIVVATNILCFLTINARSEASFLSNVFTRNNRIVLNLYSADVLKVHKIKDC